jgi:hypothetical protein
VKEGSSGVLPDVSKILSSPFSKVTGNFSDTFENGKDNL